MNKQMHTQTPSDEAIRAGVLAFQSGHNGFDDLSDWREFYRVVSEATAQRSDNDWRDAVANMLTSCEMVASDDPRQSINKLIDWHVAAALAQNVALLRGRSTP